LKDFVSGRHISTTGSISAMLLLWAVFVSPGAAWTGYVALASLAMLVVTTTVLCLGRMAPASMAQVIHDVEAETAPRASSAARERGIR
jgi:hypothetical protein